MNLDSWKERFKTDENNQILSNEYNELFPQQQIKKKSEEENKEYLKNLRLKVLNDFDFSNNKCNCSKKCNYKGIGDILIKSDNDVEKMGYDPYLKIGKCWKFHYCKGVCDEFVQDYGIHKCKYTGRKFEFTDIGFDKLINKRGKLFEIPKKSSAKNLIHTKKNVDITLNKSEADVKNGTFKLERFKKKKERKVNIQTKQLKFDVEYVLDLINIFMFKKSENLNMNIPFYIFSKKLNHFFRNVTMEQLFLSMGLINIHSLCKNKIDKKDKKDYELIKIFENKLLKLLPGFFRLKMELNNIINTQKKQYALAYKYLTDECVFKKIIPEFIELYTMLYFDDKWYGDILTDFLTWDEWTEIIYKSLKIWKLCKLCGDDKKINSISIVPEDLFVAILDIMSNGFKYNGLFIINKNLILSQKFYYLRLNKFSSYGISPKIHKNGVLILESSLKHLCRECGVKIIMDYLQDKEIPYG